MWATVVLVRKMRHAALPSDEEQKHRNYRAYRAYALLNGFGIVFLGLVALSNVIGTGWEEGALFLLGLLSTFGFFFGIVVVYLNHAPEPTSVQVKLIGLSLEERLAACLGDTGGRGSAEVIRSVLHAIGAFTGGAAPSNDITMLALRFAGVAEVSSSGLKSVRAEPERASGTPSSG